MQRWLFLSLLVMSISMVHAQLPYDVSYLAELNDTTPKREPWSDPKKATVLSLAIPGAGQIYNKKYWKAGIVYAGAAGLYFMYRYNADSMNRYQDILIAKIDGDSNTVDLYPSLSAENVISARNFYRRYRDISILGFFGLYALQAVDANVDAHLKEFKVNDDLSMRIRPRFYGYDRMGGMKTGITLNLYIR